MTNEKVIMKIASFQFELIAKDEIKLPQYKGSAFRGLFGHALKNTACVTKRSSCDDCLLRKDCPYAYMFETFNERNERVARPFILEPPMTERNLFPVGDILKVNMVLVGKAIEYLPYVVYSYKVMGKRGLGHTRGKFYLQRVTSGDKEIYYFKEQLVHKHFPEFEITLRPEKNVRNHLKINFITPTAIKSKGRVDRFDFITLLKALKRRLKALSVYHNGKENLQFNYDADHVSSIKVTSNLHPYHWKRFSNRQDREIDFDGYVGEMELQGDLAPYLPLLRVGEILHVGRGTVYGMGKYQLEEI
jgi:CRISPR-associated endoribonuclease Cas6